MTEGTDGRTRWTQRIQAWEARAEAAGLSPVLNALRDGFKPLAPVAAQFLWVAQPTIALFGEAESISALAALLEHPDAYFDPAGSVDPAGSFDPSAPSESA